MVGSNGKSVFQPSLVENGLSNSQNCHVSFYVTLASNPYWVGISRSFLPPQVEIHILHHYGLVFKKIFATQPDVLELSFTFNYSQYFPIIGPLGAEIKEQVGATVDLGFGFGTAVVDGQIRI